MPVKPKGPKTQVRTKKDTNRKEIVELKSQIEELKRTVARLRRELERNSSVEDNSPSQPDDDRYNDDVERCKYCDSSNLKRYHNMARRPIVLCGDCTKNQAPPLPQD